MNMPWNYKFLKSITHLEWSPATVHPYWMSPVHISVRRCTESSDVSASRWFRTFSASVLSMNILRLKLSQQIQPGISIPVYKRCYKETTYSFKNFFKTCNDDWWTYFKRVQTYPKPCSWNVHWWCFPKPSKCLHAFRLTNQIGRSYVHFTAKEAALECWLHVSSSALPE